MSALSWRSLREYWARWVGVLALAIVVFAGIQDCWVRVPRGDSLVVQRFGAVDRVLASGLQLKWPWPVERATLVTTSQVRWLPLGYREIDLQRGIPPTEEESQWLTGDTNLVELAAKVEFRVADPEIFLFGAQAGRDGPQGFLVRKLAEAELTERISRLAIDEVFGTAGQRLQSELEQALQSSFDAANTGLELVSVQLLGMAAPPDAQEAFAAVAEARSMAETAINRADGGARTRLQEASSQAHRLLREAQSQQTRMVAEAEGAASAFRVLAQSVAEHPQASRQRMWMEAVRNALGGAELLQVGADGAGPRVVRVRSRPEAGAGD